MKESKLKKELGGKISSHRMKKSKEAAGEALKKKIGKKRKEGEEHKEKERSGNYLFKD